MCSSAIAADESGGKGKNIAQVAAETGEG